MNDLQISLHRSVPRIGDACTLASRLGTLRALCLLKLSLSLDLALNTAPNPNTIPVHKEPYYNVIQPHSLVVVEV